MILTKKKTLFLFENMISQKKEQIKFRIGSVDIGLENVAVAAARVRRRPSRRDKKEDVYNTFAKFIILVGVGPLSDRMHSLDP